MKRQINYGFTLVEALIVIAIIGILSVIAVPSYQDMIERNRLKQAAEGLKSDMQWMRTETIKQSCNLQAAFTNGAAWSYQIYIPPAVAGTTCAAQHVIYGCPAAATANCNIKTVSSTQFIGITMATVSFFSSPTTVAEFDFRRGEAKRSNNNSNNGRVELSSTNYIVKVVISSVGRVRICDIAGSSGLSGYQNC
ncbi:MAG: prepilin-type N-terminal cleavage/methylation domain-containing protein [Methylococcales bacterium]|nr:prepilin-type N-terminal cleavage/methylation domain-containing protein [Methylococcales bacterium]